MKLLHQVHIVVLVVFFVLALYHLEWVEMTQRTRDFVPSSGATWGRAVWSAEDWYTRRAALWAGVTLLMTTLVGYWTRPSFGLVGVLFMGGGVLGMGWKGMMYYSPRHISIEEVMPAWIAYVFLGIVMSATIVIGTPEKAGAVSTSEDDLLDDQWESLTN